MESSELICRLRELRMSRELSQQALADEVGVSRQAINAIESGKQVPGTLLALRLARRLGTSVEDLFSLARVGTLQADCMSVEPGERVCLGRVDGRWVAHPLRRSSAVADAVAQHGAENAASFDPLGGLKAAESRLLVAGCAPLLGNLTERVGHRFSDASGTWLTVGSGQALAMLARGLVHVAGVHLGAESAAGHGAIAREAVGDTSLVVYNLARWRQGLVVAPGNPKGVDGVRDVYRPDLRVALREPGSGSAALLGRLLDGALPSGPIAHTHEDIGRLIQWGMADCGVAIESIAVEFGLDFIPLVDERFDIVVPRRHLAVPGVVRLIEGLHDGAFRREAQHLVGYDISSTGESAEV